MSEEITSGLNIVFASEAVEVLETALDLQKNKNYLKALQ
jgi:hypothetical protein